MRFVGVDIAAERHVFAILGEDGALLVKPTPFGEDAEGYAKLLQALADRSALVVMEATGHYWKNLFAVLVAADHPVAPSISKLLPARGALHSWMLVARAASSITFKSHYTKNRASFWKGFRC